MLIMFHTFKTIYVSILAATFCSPIGQETCSITASSLTNLMLHFLNRMKREVVTLENDLARMEIFIEDELKK